MKLAGIGLEQMRAEERAEARLARGERERGEVFSVDHVGGARGPGDERHGFLSERIGQNRRRQLARLSRRAELHGPKELPREEVRTVEQAEPHLDLEATEATEQI